MFPVWVKETYLDRSLTRKLSRQICSWREDRRSTCGLEKDTWDPLTSTYFVLMIMYSRTSICCCRQAFFTRLHAWREVLPLRGPLCAPWPPHPPSLTLFTVHLFNPFNYNKVAKKESVIHFMVALCPSNLNSIISTMP